TIHRLHLYIHSFPTRRSSDLLNKQTSKMIITWLLWLAFIIYPTIVIIFNYFIRNKLHDKQIRRKFKLQNEYILKLVYLLAPLLLDRKSTRLNSSHVKISYAVF